MDDLKFRAVDYDCLARCYPYIGNFPMNSGMQHKIGVVEMFMGIHYYVMGYNPIYHHLNSLNMGKILRFHYQW